MSLASYPNPLTEKRKIEDVKQLETSSIEAISEHLLFLQRKVCSNPIIFSGSESSGINRSLLADILLKKKVKGQISTEVDFKADAIKKCESVFQDIPTRVISRKQEYANDIEYIGTIFNHALRQIEFEIDTKVLTEFITFVYYEVIDLNEQLIKKSDIFEEIYFFVTNTIQNFVSYNQFYKVIKIIGQVEIDFPSHKFALPQKKNYKFRKPPSHQMYSPESDGAFLSLKSIEKALSGKNDWDSAENIKQVSERLAAMNLNPLLKASKQEHILFPEQLKDNFSTHYQWGKRAIKIVSELVQPKFDFLPETKSSETDHPKFDFLPETKSSETDHPKSDSLSEEYDQISKNVKKCCEKLEKIKEKDSNKMRAAVPNYAEIKVVVALDALEKKSATNALSKNYATMISYKKASFAVESSNQTDEILKADAVTKKNTREESGGEINAKIQLMAPSVKTINSIIDSVNLPGKELRLIHQRNNAIPKSLEIAIKYEEDNKEDYDFEELKNILYPNIVSNNCRRSFVTFSSVFSDLLKQSNRKARKFGKKISLHLIQAKDIIKISKLESQLKKMCLEFLKKEIKTCAYHKELRKIICDCELYILLGFYFIMVIYSNKTKSPEIERDKIILYRNLMLRKYESFEKEEKFSLISHFLYLKESENFSLISNNLYLKESDNSSEMMILHEQI